jgi:peptide/nickel transport system ATP-binding protein
MAHAPAPLVDIKGLTIAFSGTRVLHGVDLTVNRGDALGIVGESGSGKSVTWLAALGLLPGTATIGGSAKLEGQELIGAKPAILDKVRGGRIGVIFQDPSSSLNPVLTVGRQIGEALALHRGLSGRALKAEARRLMELVGIPDAPARLNAYPHEFSGGQNQRVMIAMALAGNPDLLVADEPTTALDVTIQAQILTLINDIRREMNMALVLISHDLGVIAETCDRVAVMYAGRIAEEAGGDEIFERPRHPYTQGLLGSQPPLGGVRRRLVSIPGVVPDPTALPKGCAFAPRCGHRIDRCIGTHPQLEMIGTSHRAACFTIDASSAPAQQLEAAAE